MILSILTTCIWLQTTTLWVHRKIPSFYPGDTVVIDKAGIIYIMGDVGKAGGYLIDNNEHLSLLQALTLAGGWTRTSAQSKVILIRKVPQGREEIKLDVSHVVHGEQADIKVANGDIVYVPSSIGKIFAYQGIGAGVQGARAGRRLRSSLQVVARPPVL